MIQFIRYIFVAKRHDVHPHAKQRVIKSLIHHGFMDKKSKPIGALASYCEVMNLKNPILVVVDHEIALTDPFLDPNLPRHRCPVCEKLLPSQGTIIDHPVSGEKITIDITHCVSCGIQVDDTWQTSDDLIVFNSDFFVALQADNFVVALPTISETLPQFIDLVSEAAQAPVKEIFVAKESIELS